MRCDMRMAASQIASVTVTDNDAFEGWLQTNAVRNHSHLILTKLALLPSHGIVWPNTVRHLDGNLHVLKVKHYRVYFRYEVPMARVVWWGIKGTQPEDIEKAKQKE